MDPMKPRELVTILMAYTEGGFFEEIGNDDEGATKEAFKNQNLLKEFEN